MEQEADPAAAGASAWAALRYCVRFGSAGVAGLLGCGGCGAVELGCGDGGGDAEFYRTAVIAVAPTARSAWPSVVKYGAMNVS